MESNSLHPQQMQPHFIQLHFTASPTLHCTSLHPQQCNPTTPLHFTALHSHNSTHCILVTTFHFTALYSFKLSTPPLFHCTSLDSRYCTTTTQLHFGALQRHKSTESHCAAFTTLHHHYSTALHCTILTTLHNHYSIELCCTATPVFNTLNFTTLPLLHHCSPTTSLHFIALFSLDCTTTSKQYNRSGSNTHSSWHARSNWDPLVSSTPSTTTLFLRLHGDELPTNGQHTAAYTNRLQFE